MKQRVFMAERSFSRQSNFGFDTNANQERYDYNSTCDVDKSNISNKKSADNDSIATCIRRPSITLDTKLSIVMLVTNNANCKLYGNLIGCGWFFLQTIP